jgi:hypothetical protein
MLAEAKLLSHDMKLGRNLPDGETTIGSVSQDPSQALYASAVQ